MANVEIAYQPYQRLQMGRAPSRSNPTCIYCFETKDLAFFKDREHVLQDAFGTYAGEVQAFVLHKVVCSACNKYFGETIDARLARSTLEGLERYSRGLKQPAQTLRIGGKGKLEARLKDGSFYEGSIGEWGSDGNRLVLVQVDQVGIGLADTERALKWFRLGDIPNRLTLHELGIAPGEKIRLVLLGSKMDAAERELLEKGYALSGWERIETPSPRTDSIPIEMTGTIDRECMRAVAKIAFNYLEFHYRGITRAPQFSDTRNFIRYDTGRPPVRIGNESIVAGFYNPEDGWRPVPSGAVLLGHVVTVAWVGTGIVAKVSLMGRFCYEIVLADGPFFFAPSHIRSGHFFDPINHVITPLALRFGPVPNAAAQR